VPEKVYTLYVSVTKCHFRSSAKNGTSILWCIK